MKKYPKKHRYKKWHDKRAKKIGKTSQRNKEYKHLAVLPVYERSNSERIKAAPVIAPENMCLLSKTNDCLKFFTELRHEKNVSKIGGTFFVVMDLSSVKEFDYSSICVLIAIIEDLNSKNINLRGNYTKDNSCKKRIIESGLLTFMYDDEGNKFKKSEKTDLFLIAKGAKILNREDNKNISKTIENAVKHLTGKENRLPKLKKILLEICGNSIEWSETKNKQWLFGVKYEDDKAIFTITDVGKGILKTLRKKFRNKLQDTFKKNDAILKRAFIKKYGSSSQKANRNKGLPSIKNGFNKGIINNLKVLTNNVILHYRKDAVDSEVLNNTFSGTLYRWELTKENIKNAS